MIISGVGPLELVDTMAETIGAEGIAQQLANLRQGKTYEMS